MPKFKPLRAEPWNNRPFATGRNIWHFHQVFWRPDVKSSKLPIFAENYGLPLQKVARLTTLLHFIGSWAIALNMEWLVELKRIKSTHFTIFDEIDYILLRRGGV